MCDNTDEMFTKIKKLVEHELRRANVSCDDYVTIHLIIMTISELHPHNTHI